MMALRNLVLVVGIVSAGSLGGCGTANNTSRFGAARPATVTRPIFPQKSVNPLDALFSTGQKTRAQQLMAGQRLR